MALNRFLKFCRLCILTNKLISCNYSTYVVNVNSANIVASLPNNMECMTYVNYVSRVNAIKYCQLSDKDMSGRELKKCGKTGDLSQFFFSNEGISN